MVVRSAAPAMLIVGLFMLGSLIAVPTPSQGGIADAIVIVGDEVLADGTFTFDGPVFVPAGSSLTLRNATLFLDYREVTCDTPTPIGGAAVCPAHIWVDGGRLRVIDSYVDTRTADSSKADGIQTYRIDLEAAFLHIEGSTFNHFGGLVAEQAATEVSTVVDSTFRNGDRGVAFTRGAVGMVRDSVFENLSTGSRGYDSVTIWENNRFTNIHHGRALDVESTVVGDKSYDILAVVRNNLFEDSAIGMLALDAGPSVIEDNVFRGNNLGLNLAVGVGESGDGEGPVSIKGNRFEGNVEGVSLYTSGIGEIDDTVTLKMTQGAFVDNSCTDVRVFHHAEVSYTLDLRENWWGSVDGPQNKGPGCPAITENAPTQVLVSPWLTSDPTV